MDFTWAEVAAGAAQSTSTTNYASNRDYQALSEEELGSQNDQCLQQTPDNGLFPLPYSSDFLDVNQSHETILNPNSNSAEKYDAPLDTTNMNIIDRSIYFGNEFQEIESNPLLNGHTDLVLLTSIHRKYWRNERKVLCCFPSCRIYGDYFVSRIAKPEDSKKHLVCSKPVVAEFSLLSYHEQELDTGARTLEHLCRNNKLIAVAILHEFGKPWMNTDDVSSSSTSQTSSEYDQATELLVPGCFVDSETVDPSSQANVYKGELTLVNSTKLKIEFSPKHWLYNSELSRKRRKSQTRTSELHVLEVSILQDLGNGSLRVLNSQITEPFEVESTKTLGRRVSALKAQKQKLASFISIGMFHLLNVADFQMTGTIPIVFANDGDRSNDTEKSSVFSWVSGTSKSVMGYDPEELIGKDSWQFVERQDAEHLMSATKTEEGDSFKMFVRFRRICKNNERNWTKLYAVKSAQFPDMVTMEHEFEHKDCSSSFMQEASRSIKILKEAIRHTNFTLKGLRAALSELGNFPDEDSWLCEKLSLIYCEACSRLADIGALSTSHIFSVKLHPSKHDILRNLLGKCQVGMSIQPAAHDIAEIEINSDSNIDFDLPSIVPITPQKGFPSTSGLIRGHKDLMVLADMCDELLFIQTNPAGFILWVSNSSQDMLGYDPNEMVFTNQWKYVHALDIPKLSKKNNMGPCTRSFLRRRTKLGQLVVMESVSVSLGQYDMTVERRVASNHKELVRRKCGALNLVTEVLEEIWKIGENFENNLSRTHEEPRNVLARKIVSKLMEDCMQPREEISRLNALQNIQVDELSARASAVHF